MSHITMYQWKCGSMRYCVNMKDKHLVPIKDWKINPKDIQSYWHTFILKRIDDRHVLISNYTSSRFSHINKENIENIKFKDFTNTWKIDKIKYMSRPMIFTNEEIEQFFEFDYNYKNFISLLGLKEDDLDYSFFNNIILNFKFSNLHNIQEEEIFRIIEVENKGNYLKLLVRVKEKIFIIDEFDNIYIDKYINIHKNNINIALLNENKDLFTVSETSNTVGILGLKHSLNLIDPFY